MAVALGAQDLFKNLIAGILIIGENRFQPGDRIEVIGEMHGMVEQIGFRSTTVRLFNTAPMVIPNKDLSDVKVINHGNMVFRRLNWTINLVYSTTIKINIIIIHIKQMATSEVGYAYVLLILQPDPRLPCCHLFRRRGCHGHCTCLLLRSWDQRR